MIPVKNNMAADDVANLLIFHFFWTVSSRILLEDESYFFWTVSSRILLEDES